MNNHILQEIHYPQTVTKVNEVTILSFVHILLSIFNGIVQLVNFINSVNCYPCSDSVYPIEGDGKCCQKRL